MPLFLQAPSRLWHRAWPDYRPAIRRMVLLTLQEAGAPDDFCCTLRLSRDAEVRTLNQQFRGIDKPTNVLSFVDTDVGYGGDSILAYETVAREAGEQQKVFAHHALHLVVHSVLHLLSYDHERDDEAQRMESLEIHILAAAGLTNPYLEQPLGGHVLG